MDNLELMKQEISTLAKEKKQEFEKSFFNMTHICHI